MNVKREIMYCKPQMDGDNAYYEIDSDKMDNEYFKQNLRTNKGIFFNLNVSPASPRKARSPQHSPRGARHLALTTTSKFPGPSPKPEDSTHNNEQANESSAALAAPNTIKNDSENWQDLEKAEGGGKEAAGP